MSPRLLHLVGWFFPESTGGSEVYVDSLARALEPLGFRSEVAVPAEGRGPGRYEYRGLTVHRHPVGDAGAFREWLRDAAPDLVHFHSLTPAQGADEAAAVTEFGAPLVFTAHVATVVCARGTMMRWGRS